MKYYTGNATFKFTWDQIASGFWSRYPNPYSSHVLSEDTISRHVANGKLFTKRLLVKTNSLPKWGERFVPGAKSCCIVEESVVDPKSKTVTTYTRNIGMTSIMSIDEKCVYAPSKDNKNWTEVTREAWINSSIFGLQTFGYGRFKKNANKTIKGFEHVLNKLYIPESIPDVGKLHLNTEVLRKKAKEATDNLNTDALRKKAKEATDKAKEAKHIPKNIAKAAQAGSTATN